MRNFLILSITIFFLWGCYKFQSPPFPEKDLTLISDTRFGKEVVKVFKTMDAKTLKNSPFSVVNSEQKVFVIDDNMLLLQEKKKNKKKVTWEIGVLMKTSSHIMLCLFTEAENVNAPKSVEITKVEAGMEFSLQVNGPQEELRKLALKLVDKSAKICLGVPFKSITG